MSKNKNKPVYVEMSAERYKLRLPTILLWNEVAIKNNIRRAKEIGLEVKIELVNDEIKFTVNDPSKPRRKRFYELRDDNRYTLILNRLFSLYK
jgi:hypothetical protein